MPEENTNNTTMETNNNVPMVQEGEAYGLDLGTAAIIAGCAFVGCVIANGVCWLGSAITEKVASDRAKKKAAGATPKGYTQVPNGSARKEDDNCVADVVGEEVE